jgi:hypothetical protein
MYRRLMGHYIQALFFVIIGTALLWFGYTLFFGVGAKVPAWGGRYRKRRGKRPRNESFPGAPQTCPVCSAKLEEGELVKSSAFPSLNGGKDRFMHIRGCVYCLHGDRERICPVCGRVLRDNEILVARMFERPHRRSHVHVLGCSRCRGTGKSRSR